MKNPSRRETSGSHEKPNQDVQRSLKSLRMLIDSIPNVAILQTDITGQIVFWSAAATQIFGYSNQEAIGMSFEALFSPQDRDNGIPAQTLKATLNPGRHTCCRWHSRHDSSQFFADTSYSPLHDDTNTLHGYCIVIRDITEFKTEEDARARQCEQILHANRVKDEFLATLSHELRTPLGVILGNLELLDEAAFGSPEYHESLAAIRRNALLQSQLINDLLDVSRIINGKLQLAVQAVDIADLAQKTIDSMRFYANSKELTLDVTMLEQNLTIEADPDRIQQVLCNLLSNAIKFTPRGGRIDLKLTSHDDSIELIVEDSGAGIDPNFLPLVFDRFQQEDNSHARNYGGLGLGLAIVQHIVELHGGKIAAYSRGKGYGSSFTVTLPKKLSPQSTDQPYFVS